MAAASAANGAKVVCDLKTTCAKVFALAQIYIATETDQKIQVVTDSVIQTYNPNRDRQRRRIDHEDAAARR
jgi:hypothetical protein